jgi:MarR family transcriptional regulator, organic hydroperoxide resistance regulator
VRGLFLDHQLCFALYATSLAMTKVYRRLLAPLGLTYPQYVVMLALWQHSELSVGALGEQVALDSGTLAPLIRKLAALGFVERRRSRIDDRSVLVSLTAAGAKLRAGASAVHAQMACATQCSRTELKAMTRQLQSLRAALVGGQAA